MRILFVGMAESIHTARWIRQLEGLGWDLHLFPSWCDAPHPELPPLRYYPPVGSRSGRRVRRVGRTPLRVLPTVVGRKLRKAFPRWFPEARRLARTIARLRPNLVHSLEIQHAGYLVLDAKRHLTGRFPPWLVTNWGSDTYFFARIDEHRRKIQQVLAECDYYDCECQRDQRVARDLGFRGQLFRVTPNAGGYDLPRLRRLRAGGPTSQRRLILLKGYQDWAGRALVGLRAIELCADVLTGYRVGIYRASPDVQLVARAVADSTGIPIDCLPPCSHEQMLRHHGAARISIGISASDALSTSFLEALVMGSFPIQSNTASADEWITHGVTGMITDPHDPQDIAAAIRRAATDDRLVDRAVPINDRVCDQRLAYETVRRQVLEMYQTIHDQQRSATLERGSATHRTGQRAWSSARSVPRATVHRPSPEPRKVAILSHTLPPDSNGQALVLKRLLEGAEPDRFCLISGQDGPPTTLPLPHFRIPPAPAVPPVKFLKLLVHPSQLAVNIWWWSRHLQRILAEQHCQVLVACTGEVHELPAAARAARRAGVALIPYVFDWYRCKYGCLRGWHGRVLRSYASRIEGPVLRQAEAVIVPNETLKEAYRGQYGIEPVVIRNPTDFVPPAAAALPPPSRSDRRDTVICYTGAIYQAHYDAFANLMEAVGRLRDTLPIRLRLYTDADPDGLGVAGLRGPVEVLPRVPLDQIPAVHQQADILFLPLAFRSPYPEIVRTSAPGKMADYLASRRPILVHAPPGSFVSWYFRTHDCGLVVDRADPAALAEALVRLVRDAPLRQRIANNAAERVRQDFQVATARAAFARVVGHRPTGLAGPKAHSPQPTTIPEGVPCGA